MVAISSRDIQDTIFIDTLESCEIEDILKALTKFQQQQEEEEEECVEHITSEVIDREWGADSDDENIDSQLCIKGNETIGWNPREKCTVPNGDYNPEKDVRFFNDSPDMFFQLTDGQFAIFFPEDVHAPMIGDGEIKKLVVKVKI